MRPDDQQSDAILKVYAAGDISATDAAYDVQALGLPDFENSSASEIIPWPKATGYGIPMSVRRAP